MINKGTSGDFPHIYEIINDGVPGIKISFYTFPVFYTYSRVCDC